MIRENKKYSRQQTSSSLAVLFILLVIGTGIFLAQFNYNPSILQEDLFSPPTATDKDSSLTTLTESIIPLPPGMVPLTLAESFDAQNLSDKINGKAELYLSAGFISLNSQRYKDKKGSNLWVEAYIYDMDNGQNAFSVFSAQRREGAAALDLTRYAYRTSNALFLVHGRFYIEIIASEATDRAFNSVKLLAENFIGNTATQTVTIPEKDLFPVPGLVADSISLISTDAFGFDRLNQIYTAEYELGQERLMAFLSRRQETRAAQDLASAYQKFLETFGGQNIDVNLAIKDAKLMEILETYEVIFSCGPFMAGVREAASKEQAIALAVQLYQKLKEVVDESGSG
ncbi:MAG: DUF6599 family protein [Desulfobacterales bacterium]